MKKNLLRILPLLLMLSLLLSSCAVFVTPSESDTYVETVANVETGASFSLADVPAYSNQPYVNINNGQPYFTKAEIAEAAASYERYSDLDSLGRCGVTMASVGQDLMPTSARDDISKVKPSGWKNQKYDFVDGQYVYNRCHLIGFQLTGENANEKNLITGTRYMNVQGMLRFENMVADYVKETNNHVLYRVTPFFAGNDLVAAGVLMEAMSVEDDGDGVLFCVWCYNVQPGVVIDYADGSNHASGEDPTKPEPETNADGSVIEADYVLNTSSKKFHLPTCSGVATMLDKNKQLYKGNRQDLIDQGYAPCGSCHP